MNEILYTSILYRIGMLSLCCISISAASDTVTVHNASPVNTVYVTNVIYTRDNNRKLSGNLKKVVRLAPGKSISFGRPGWKMQDDRDIWFTAGEYGSEMAHALSSGDRGWMVMGVNVGSNSDIYLMGSTAYTSRAGFEKAQHKKWNDLVAETSASSQAESIPAKKFIDDHKKDPVKKPQFNFD